MNADGEHEPIGKSGSLSHQVEVAVRHGIK
jgi:hypothetical protein